MERKIFAVKEMGGTGEFSAEIATLNVKDKDGDVTLPGFFGKQAASVVLSHNWGPVMLGKGQIVEEGDKAVFEGKMNMADADAEARAVHSRLKFDVENPPALIEWSYGFEVLPGGREPFKNHPDFGDGSYLKPLTDGSPGVKVYEVSPVLVGAGEGTGTRQVKSGQTISMLDALAELGDNEAKELLEIHKLLDLKTDDQKFIDQLRRTVSAVEAVNDRALEISEHRKLGRESAAAIREIAEAILDLEQKLRGVTVVDTNLELGLPSVSELEVALAEAEARITGRAYARTY